MAVLLYDSAHFDHTIDKVAKWMATFDSQVCLFADDTSDDILSSRTPSTSSAGEQDKQILIDRLKCEAVSRNRLLFRSTAIQENNHNESKKKPCQRAPSMDSRSSSEASPNQNRNNRHASESEHRRKSHTESRHRRPSQPSNSHSVSQRKDSGDGSGGGGGFKEDKYLERIVDRATQEIRSAIYKLRAENKLPESCHLKMKLSIKPQRTGGRSDGAVSSPKDSPTEQHKRRQHDERRRGSNTGRHRATDREVSGRSERDKRPTSSSNRHEHHEQKKEKRKSGY